ncbi:uncharacterized protein F5Z01DRAFT_676046 [Emericellopsis atlantica]|uniref:Uncharacterized protein n=1 Tax=Emericellopsis atlantica TaxID=2614577 RepID=A0A9P7ZIE9_9HYPO|nr:uncharacterized protein F5Z01DRAFT_676046 [Emericellopsis atlantica]KAG9252155.1 hypothetical protein F5Z01DRAFT_676046 [Emericellopsis atlantica]
MNTIKSFWLGWGSLCVAGVGAYIFAKKEINADRQAKLEAYRRKQDAIRDLEHSEGAGSAGNRGAAANYNGWSPSQEASNDPAPTRHEPTTEQQRVSEKGKHETDRVYRSPKGDRFS